MKHQLKTACGNLKRSSFSTLLNLTGLTAAFAAFLLIMLYVWNEYHFEQYVAENRVEMLSRYSALIAIVISSLGLMSLAAFSAERKIKEIGIRKVNGATIFEMITMLNRDFIKWVAIAFVIATPIAYFAMHIWLENFAYETTLSWCIFALAGLLALGIASLTVSWQSWTAATRNPVEALRYE